jgi:hypothetical protein
MTEQQTKPAPAVEAPWQAQLDQARDEHVRRLARAAARAGRDYDARAFLQLRDLFGAEQVTIERWRSYGGLAARSTLDALDPNQGWWWLPTDQAAEDIQRLREQIAAYRTAAVDYRRCCDDCQRQADLIERDTIPREERRLAEMIAAQQGTPTPAVIEPEQPEVPTRTCGCSGCTESECDGDCDDCDNSGCGQCHGDHGAHDDCDTCNEDHSVCDGCGYCSECEEHLEQYHYPQYGADGSCDQGHCHSCEHEC